MKLTKEERHEHILSLIKSEPILTQQDLVSRLREKGIEITQATASRDIAELKLVKVNIEGVTCYQKPKRDATHAFKRLSKLLIQSYRSMSIQENMIVLYTLPGSAPAVSNLVNEVFFEDLFTVMSNDDHLLLIAKSNEGAQEIYQELKTIIPKERRMGHVTRTFHS